MNAKQGAQPYELSLDAYKGPLETLLGLILEKKMEISLVSLAEVTGDFLNYVTALEEDPRYQSLVADFLVIASKLIFIKSKTLLPSLPLTEEEEEDIQNLESRLKLYKELKDAERHLESLWSEVPQMGTREFLMSSERVFFPPEKTTIESLRESMAKAYGELERMHAPVEKIAREVVNLKQKIKEVMARITAEPLAFGEFRKSASRTELVVLFLAVLHLVRDQMLSVNQDKHFSEIFVAKKGENA